TVSSTQVWTHSVAGAAAQPVPQSPQSPPRLPPNSLPWSAIALPPMTPNKPIHMAVRRQALIRRILIGSLTVPDQSTPSAAVATFRSPLTTAVGPEVLARQH